MNLQSDLSPIMSPNSYENFVSQRDVVLIQNMNQIFENNKNLFQNSMTTNESYSQLQSYLKKSAGNVFQESYNKQEDEPIKEEDLQVINYEETHELQQENLKIDYENLVKGNKYLMEEIIFLKTQVELVKEDNKQLKNKVFLCKADLGFERQDCKEKIQLLNQTIQAQKKESKENESAFKLQIKTKEEQIFQLTKQVLDLKDQTKLDRQYREETVVQNQKTYYNQQEIFILQQENYELQRKIKEFKMKDFVNSHIKKKQEKFQSTEVIQKNKNQIKINDFIKKQLQNSGQKSQNSCQELRQNTQSFQNMRQRLIELRRHKSEYDLKRKYLKNPEENIPQNQQKKLQKKCHSTDQLIQNIQIQKPCSFDSQENKILQIQSQNNQNLTKTLNNTNFEILDIKTYKPQYFKSKQQHQINPFSQNYTQQLIKTNEFKFIKPNQFKLNPNQ